MCFLQTKPTFFPALNNYVSGHEYKHSTSWSVQSLDVPWCWYNGKDLHGLPESALINFNTVFSHRSSFSVTFRCESLEALRMKILLHYITDRGFWASIHPIKAYQTSPINSAWEAYRVATIAGKCSWQPFTLPRPIKHHKQILHKKLTQWPQSLARVLGSHSPYQGHQTSPINSAWEATQWPQSLAHMLKHTATEPKTGGFWKEIFQSTQWHMLTDDETCYNQMRQNALVWILP